MEVLKTLRNIVYLRRNRRSILTMVLLGHDDWVTLLTSFGLLAPG